MPITQPTAQTAAALLRAAGLHGQEYAMFSATAHAQPGRVHALPFAVEGFALLNPCTRS